MISRIPAYLQPTVIVQNRLGWLSFLKGFWHKEWTFLQEEYYLTTNQRTNKMNGQTWGRSVLKTIWANMHLLWITYTHQLHKSTANNPSITHRQLQEKIRILQRSYRHYCPHLNQHYLLTDHAIENNTNICLQTWFHVQAPVLQKEITVARNQQKQSQRTIYYYYWRPSHE